MNLLLDNDVKQSRHVVVSDDFKADSGAIILAGAFARHEPPPANQCPNWLPSWLCTPIPELIGGDKKMANKPKTPKGSTAKPGAKPKPQTKPTTTTPTAPESAKNTTKKTYRPRKPRIKPEMDGPTANSSPLKSFDASQARVTDNELTSVQTVYPYEIDMYTYHCAFYPTGDDSGTTSIARGYFNSATGVKLLVDINHALRKSNTITVANIADYVNRVASAYFTMQVLRNHLSVCYSAPHYSSLRNRLSRLYDEAIPTAHMELAASLRSHFLPSGAVQVIDQLAKVYSTAPHEKSTLLQLFPFATPVNNATDIIALLNAANVSINSTTGTNMVDIVTALSNERYTGGTVSMSRLSTEVLIDNDAAYLRTIQPTYDADFLSLWGNLPYHASDTSSGRITHFDVNDRFTNITKFAFGDKFTFVENALTANYVSADSRYQPGILEPSFNIVGGSNRTTLTYINDTGVEAYVNNTGYGSFAHGAMCKISTYSFNQTNLVAVRIGGTAIIYTNANEVGQDAYKLIRNLNNISTTS